MIKLLLYRSLKLLKYLKKIHLKLMRYIEENLL